MTYRWLLIKLDIIKIFAKQLFKYFHRKEIMADIPYQPSSEKACVE